MLAQLYVVVDATITIVVGTAGTPKQSRGAMRKGKKVEAHCLDHGGHSKSDAGGLVGVALGALYFDAAAGLKVCEEGKVMFWAGFPSCCCCSVTRKSGEL